MPPVTELGKAILIEAADAETNVEVSLTVGSSNAAGDSEITLYVVTKAIDSREYPVLAAVWDEDDDDFYDSL